MNPERMQPADFDAVYRLLTQSFPATERRGAAGQRALETLVYTRVYGQAPAAEQ